MDVIGGVGGIGVLVVWGYGWCGSASGNYGEGGLLCGLWKVV